jgi:hypothetical protein
VGSERGACVAYRKIACHEGVERVLRGERFLNDESKTVVVHCSRRIVGFLQYLRNTDVIFGERELVPCIVGVEFRKRFANREGIPTILVPAFARI